MKLLTKLSILLVTLLALLSACEESDKFSNSPNLGLEYSTDTLRFDTVFSTIVSPMQKLKVYNRNNNSISFESIKLMNPEKSGFRINVQGRTGTLFNGVDLLRKDSIHIIVDIKAKEQNKANILVRDSICLQWNGNTKYIQLGAYGLDVHIWDEKKIDSNTELTANKGYYIRGEVTVTEGFMLNIKEGTTLYFDQKGSLTVNGTLLAKGTIKKPITFRGHRFDFIQSGIPYDNASGQWQGITIGSNSFNNLIENTKIKNSHIGINFEASLPDQKKASLVNTIIHNTSEYGVKAINCNIDAINCLFSNSKGSLLNLVGGKYSFLHCTIANYYQWHARTTSSLILEDTNLGNKYPFAKCEFANSIIVGTFKEEMSVQADNQTISPFLFTNCIIQTTKAHSDSEFINPIWNIESVFPFKYLNENNRFYYNFELTEESSARNNGDATLAQQAPLDIKGISRISASKKPDIGCYEWTP